VINVNSSNSLVNNNNRGGGGGRFGNGFGGGFGGGNSFNLGDLFNNNNRGGGGNRRGGGRGNRNRGNNNNNNNGGNRNRNRGNGGNRNRGNGGGGNRGNGGNGRRNRNGGGRNRNRREVTPFAPAPVIYADPQTWFLEASLEDSDDCLKKYVCVISSKPQGESNAEHIIRGAFAETLEEMDAAAASVEFDLASVVGRTGGVERCQSLYARCPVQAEEVGEMVEDELKRIAIGGQ